ncbi:Protein piccolo [Orchesella cincta]|uniref:Protein piccolo n=1 Tax=Orchesella cincta TaxID=48709 RepID=A0A1D2M317_ORCCI|nr:Protein piccolo [Orchesella cincta]
MDCQEDCSLAFTPGLTIFEGCVNCLQGRGLCSFYLNGHCMEGPGYACANRKPYNFRSCPPITELLNCSSVCKPEPMPPAPPPSTPSPPTPHRHPTPNPPFHPQPPLIRLAPQEPIDFPFNF